MQNARERQVGRTSSLIPPPSAPPHTAPPANLVFQDTVERIFVGSSFTDVPKGMCLIRGENVVMLGEVDLDADPPPQVRPVLAAEEMQALQREHEAGVEARKRRDQRKAEIMKAQKGFCEEGAEGDNY